MGQGPDRGAGPSAAGKAAGTCGARAKSCPRPCPLPISPSAPDLSVLCICPHLPSGPFAPLAGWSRFFLPTYLPWVPGRQPRLDALSSQPPVLPHPPPPVFSLAPAFPSLPFSYLTDHLVPTNPNLALPLGPESRLFLLSQYIPTPNLAPSFFSPLFQCLPLLPSPLLSRFPLYLHPLRSTALCS